AGRHPFILFWDPGTGKEQGRIQCPQAALLSLAYSPDGKLLAGATAKVVYIWDPATGKEVRRLDAVPGEVSAIAFSARGDLLAAGHSTSIRLWKASTGKSLRVIPVEGGAGKPVFSPDGRIVAASGKDHTV